MALCSLIGQKSPTETGRECLNDIKTDQPHLICLCYLGPVLSQINHKIKYKNFK